MRRSWIGGSATYPGSAVQDVWYMAVVVLNGASYDAPFRTTTAMYQIAVCTNAVALLVEQCYSIGA